MESDEKRRKKKKLVKVSPVKQCRVKGHRGDIKEK